LVEVIQVWGWFKVNWGSVLLFLFLLSLAVGVGLVLTNISKIVPWIYELTH
jgi:hypothetical protein